LTPRKFKLVIAGLQLLLKGYQAKYFRGKYSHTIYCIYFTEKGCGILDFISDFRGVIVPAKKEFGGFHCGYDIKCETALGRE
jgi:hypothetical protein